jgi:hypothetical protein
VSIVAIDSRIARRRRTIAPRAKGADEFVQAVAATVEVG